MPCKLKINLGKIVIPAVYCHISSGKHYSTCRTIMNKTSDTFMVMYHDLDETFVREYDDFVDKFVYVRD